MNSFIIRTFLHDLFKLLRLPELEPSTVAYQNPTKRPKREGTSITSGGVERILRRRNVCRAESSIHFRGASVLSFVDLLKLWRRCAVICVAADVNEDGLHFSGWVGAYMRLPAPVSRSFDSFRYLIS